MNFNVSLPLALLIGAGFGACLEMAGLGKASKLAGQFTLRDFTVLKVMFSAIVTAMLGVFWLGRFELIDLGALYVPDTFLWAQIGGGLIFGAGFVLSGLCPGTACVAAASGRIDGWFAIAGMFAGVLLTGLAIPSLTGLYLHAAAREWTLPAALNLPYGVVVAAVALMAVGMFAAIEQWEQRT
jgi:uncharacterized membrane protein YedE/YeeE